MWGTVHTDIHMQEFNQGLSLCYSKQHHPQLQSGASTVLGNPTLTRFLAEESGGKWLLQYEATLHELSGEGELYLAVIHFPSNHREVEYPETD